MGIKAALNHITSYRYERPVELGPQIVRLRPAPHCKIPILAYSMKVKPEKHFINWQQDPQGNFLARLVFPEKSDYFEIEIDLIIDMTVINPFDFFLEESAEKYPFEYEPDLKKELTPFLETTDDAAIIKYCEKIPEKNESTINFLVDLVGQLQKEVNYLVRMEPGVQTPSETLEKKSGSCRDSAWLLVQILRRLGLAARFVSGYLVQLTPDTKSLTGPSGTEVDFTDLHAWTEVYLPGAGWIGLDATSGLLVGESHIPLVATPDPQSAAPISGLVEVCETKFEHRMSVTRYREEPRVTRPYTDEIWEEVKKSGYRIDKLLNENDVRLTSGGEPTFISIDDFEGAEWNTAALGEKKLELAKELLDRLQKGWAPQGALLYSGQGKWYPGEQLPRWVLGCFWRKDQKPLWKNRLLLDQSTKGSYTSSDARRLVEELTRQMGLSAEFIIPAYEDIPHYLLRENRLPANVTPTDSRLDDPLERNRLVRLFQQGLGEVAGFVLPIGKKNIKSEKKWASSVWYLRSEHLFLIPGDSPIGLRLPLASLPWQKPEERQIITVRDPMDDPGELADPERYFPSVHSDEKQPLKGEATEIIHTALCFEVREGKLHLFFPPVDTLEDYLELLAAIEAAAEATGLAVVIEGYEPPFDTRLNTLKITPDPGVIEVNVPPVKSFDEVLEQTESLYSEARENRLGTEKFMLDGRHTGTGGGNHFVFGGPTPAESPFLRRPDLLASMVTFWNNHPALSYLFSGLFIGPTSQAPRIDEGRWDSLYEVEIAIEQMWRETDGEKSCPPWLVDRLFRNLLVDGTGNTHRAEICIDKLFSPDSATGRLGLVELRGFEMPPHYQMSVVQQLLLRALLLSFWKNPIREKLIHWNTTLHDRFMLPHFVVEDLKEVLYYLREYGFTEEWFFAHVEFRFPLIGSVVYEGMELELRTAIEPWYVLGEEPVGGGTSRAVDSSLERIQVKIRGLLSERYAVVCNGYRLPLHPTGAAGEYVAGVRYRAWQPPSCLHPTIGVNTPLLFEIVDLNNQRSIGGCTYHVSHPGGRNYDSYPVNAYEAEARRQARFVNSGHTSTILNPKTVVHPDFPLTLDLRRR